MKKYELSFDTKMSCREKRKKKKKKKKDDESLMHFLFSIACKVCGQVVWYQVTLQISLKRVFELWLN